MDSMVDTSEYLARDLENLAERLRDEDCRVLDVNWQGTIGKQSKMEFSFEVEWLE